jgi:hypothetical protein
MTQDRVEDYAAEYGPTPPGARHEHTDIDVRAGYQFGLWLVVSMLISAGVVYGSFRFFEGQAQMADSRAQKYPLAIDQLREPPLPHLQKQPFKDLYLLRQGESERLTSYGWIDKDGGVMRIPIDRAMDVMLQKGIASRPDGGDGVTAETQDSSSGRTRAPR